MSMSSAPIAIKVSEFFIKNSEYKFDKNSQVIIKYTKSVSVPRNMAFWQNKNAFGGWFSSIVSTDYDLYHSRRMVKVRTPDMKNAAKGKVKSDDSKSNFTSTTSETRDDDDQQLDQELEEHSDEDGDDDESKSDSKTYIRIVCSNLDINDDDDDDDDDDCNLQTHQISGHAESDMNLDEDDGKKVLQDPKRRSIYYIYKVSNHRRQKLLQYAAAFTAGHLGAFAFLCQAYSNRDAITQICYYAQLAVLLLCSMLYAGSYMLDIIVVLKIIYDAQFFDERHRRDYDVKRKGDKIYRHRIFAVSEVDISPQQIQEKQKQLDEENGGLKKTLFQYSSYTSPILDILFAVFAMVIEWLAIVYVYNNTQGNVQGQDDRSQQT